MARLLSAWRGMRRFRALPRRDRAIVFYAEDGASWVHFEPVIRALTTTHGQGVCYLTSSPRDPVLEREDEAVRAFYIGDGACRTFLLRILEAGVVVMTMPDLETFHIKRSKYPVHYIYLHHSIVSTHMIYRRGAFDGFDTVFCVGPHHLAEIRETEALYGLKPKALAEHGYGRLDSIIAAAKASPTPEEGPGRRILIAPSWGPHGLLESCGARLVEILLAAGHRVTVRPHPMTRRHSPKLLDSLDARFASHPRFAYEEDLASQDSLHASHLMISDWSGAALEYAFGLKRPVLFVDVPRKANNPEYTRLSAEPIEVFIREEIGAVITPDRLDQTPRLVDALCAQAGAFAERAVALRSRWIYNLGKSGEVGAAYIAAMPEAAQGNG